MKKSSAFLTSLFIAISVFAHDSVHVDTHHALKNKSELTAIDSARVKSIMSIMYSTFKEFEDVCRDDDGQQIVEPEKKILHIIKKNTTSNWFLDNFNLYGLFALVISVGAAFYTLKTYHSQKETEKHTQNAPIKAQLGILEDMPRHFYRNLVCTYAIIFKYKDKRNYSSGTPLGYPSESNFLKLQTMPEDVLLKIDANPNLYRKMHEAGLLFRNYCIEIQVASKHIARKNISPESLKTDFDNLIFKPLFLTRKSGELKASIEKIELKKATRLEEVVLDSILTIIREHIEKLDMDHPNYSEDILNAFETTVDTTKAFERSLDFLLKDIKNHTYKCFSSCRIERNKLKLELLSTASDQEKITKWFSALHFMPKTYTDVIEKDSMEIGELLNVILRLDMAVEAAKTIGMINFDTQAES